MKRVAVFGKPGSGKSRLSKRLAQRMNLDLYPLDAIIYKANGELIDLSEYTATHNNILKSEQWLIEGFAPMTAIDSFFQRLGSADTLIYIDLPYWQSYWLVTKRWLTSPFAKPEGWPQGHSIRKGTLASYRTLKLCPKFWNQGFLNKLQNLADTQGKSLSIIRSIRELDQFLMQYESQ